MFNFLKKNYEKDTDNHADGAAGQHRYAGPGDRLPAPGVTRGRFFCHATARQGRGHPPIVTGGRFFCHDSAPELLHISRVLRNFVTNLYIAVIFVAFLFLVSK